MEDHLANLQRTCRICEAPELGERSGKKVNFKAEIYRIYQIDINKDETEIHPPSVCFSCLKKLYLARSNKDYKPLDTSVSKFKEHVDDSCSVCASKNHTHVKRRGRPAKRRGGNRKSKQTCSDTVCTKSPDKTPLKSVQPTTSKENEYERFIEDLFSLPLDAIPYNWSVKKDGNTVILTQINGVPVPTVSASITVNPDVFTVFIHNIALPDDHELYNARGRHISSLQQLSTVLTDITMFSVCCGNYDEEFVELIPNTMPCQTRGAFVEGNFGAVAQNGEMYSTTVRSVQCTILINKLRCDKCIKYRNTLRAMISRKFSSNTLSKDTTKVNYRFRSPEQLTTQVITEREQRAAAEGEIERLRKLLDEKIDKEGVQLDASVAEDLKEIMNSKPDLPFPDNSLEKLFWQQQLQAASVSNPRLIRWHPSIIKLCLNLNMTSTKAYRSLANSGVFKLPSVRTLQDYTHYIKVKSGLQVDVIRQMQEQATKCGLFDGPEWKRYVVLIIDEMKIKQDLVFDKHTGEIIGFTNLGSANEELKHIDKKEPGNKMATHIMATMVRAVCSNFKFQLSHYPTTCTTAGDIFPIVWEIIEHLELRNFKVLAVTCDGASVNRRFFRMHRPEGAASDYLTYSTPNPFAPDERHLFFIADAPHLLKTTRNCWSNSYSHKMSRKLWNSGYDISWMHLVDVYSQDLDAKKNRNLRLAPKIKNEHVNLTSFSLMRVRLAAQVLSSTVANVMGYYNAGSDAVTGTIQFIRMFDRWFDCMNVRSFQESVFTRKPDLAPYTDINDERFKFLTEGMDDYLDNWAKSVSERPGEFTQGERNQMMISRETIEGRAFVGAAKHLLGAGASFVLSEHFCQDILEQEFSKHRHHGGSNENPTAQVFNYQSASLRVQSGFAAPSARGNTSVNAKRPEIEHEPLAKRRRNKKY